MSYVQLCLLGVEGAPQNNAGREDDLSLEGEGEHTALAIIPFTLSSLLLCNDMTGEHAAIRKEIASIVAFA